MLRPVAEAEALAAMLEDPRINALCLGPGLGVGEREAALVAVALRRSRGEPRPTVLDADALTLLSRDAALFAALHEGCVLTPHAGEFARLFPDIAAKLAAPATKGPAYSKVDACREAAARAGCVVLFKGPDTVIADPDGRCSINSAHYDRAAPWLATAGSGDVLAGFITGLLARGFTPAMRAAETAAWLHVECCAVVWAGADCRGFARRVAEGVSRAWGCKQRKSPRGFPLPSARVFLLQKNSGAGYCCGLAGQFQPAGIDHGRRCRIPACKDGTSLAEFQRGYIRRRPDLSAVTTA